MQLYVFVSNLNMFVFKGEPVRTLFFCLFFLFGELLKEKYGLTASRKKRERHFWKKKKKKKKKEKEDRKNLGSCWRARVCVGGVGCEGW